ncbi:MAG: trigger factor family protein, partial [Clostridia bacterium]|nr:trigger factor family protein [Clostridia bacterium]
MAFIKTTDNGKNQHVIEFSIAKEAFDAEVSKIFKEKAKNLTVPGFRKGKAPRNIIEKMYGKGIFFEDALNNLIPAEYEAAAKESGLDIVSRPEIDVESLDDNGVVI